MPKPLTRDETATLCHHTLSRDEVTTITGVSHFDLDGTVDVEPSDFNGRCFAENDNGRNLLRVTAYTDKHSAEDLWMDYKGAIDPQSDEELPATPPPTGSWVYLSSGAVLYKQGLLVQVLIDHSAAGRDTHQDAKKLVTFVYDRVRAQLDQGGSGASGNAPGGSPSPTPTVGTSG